MFYLILCNDKTNSRCMYILCTSCNKSNLILSYLIFSFQVFGVEGFMALALIHSLRVRTILSCLAKRTHKINN